MQSMLSTRSTHRRAARCTGLALGVLLALWSSPTRALASPRTATQLAPSSGATDAADEGTPGARSSADEPVAKWQGELLDRAFATASALPVQPHLKDRCKAQEQVVDTCLELGDTARALRFLEQIGNWRRGAAYADLAFHCAQHGGGPEVAKYLELALELADHPLEENPQDWQRDRIRAKVARTHALLGDLGEAARLEKDVQKSEAGRVAIVTAAKLDAKDLDAQLSAVDAVVAAGEFEQIRHALDACVELLGRFWDDAGKRAAIEQKILSASTRLPVSVRIDVVLKRADVALAHRDAANALVLSKDAQGLADAAKWRPEDEIPLIARIAVLRHRAGAADEARAEVARALALYDAERAKIVDIDRAGVLRSLAEAHRAMGDAATALSLCRRVVEEGVVNPNSRPRAEDLCATCCSMALHGIEPDAELQARMVAIQGGLGRPW
jgi:hypothetical protein